MKTVVVFLAPGFEEVEAITPIDYLRRAGCKVISCSIPSADSQDESDHGKNKAYACSKIVKGSHGIEICADYSLDEFVNEKLNFVPDAVFAPGGMPGAANITANEVCCSLIKKVFANDGIVAAICAAPVVVLAKTGILAGKKYTCYPGMNEDLPKYCGSAYPKAVEKSEYVSNVPFVKDGNILTGFGPGGAEQFAIELVAMLCGKSEADILKQRIVAR